jgi:hypothetical protein
VPEFRVLLIAPGPRLPGLWTYVSVGCWDAAHDERQRGMEFVLITPEPSDRHTRTLAMVAFYNANPSHRLELGDTLALGEPWVEGAEADHLLISLPYAFGATFEWCHWRDGSAQMLWLLPITAREHEFKRARGLEALEQRFDEVGIEYWSPSRSSSI